MPIFIPAKIVIIGEYKNAARFIARGQSEMRTLLGDMDQRGLKRHVRRVVPEPGCSIECENVFGQKTITITVRGGGRKLREHITEELWKVFVHVDVLDFSEWVSGDRDEVWETRYSRYDIDPTAGTQYVPDWISGDLLTRGMIRSGVACGLVDITNRALKWQDVKAPYDTILGHDLLAQQLGGSPISGWEGVAVDLDDTDAIFQYYDTLFAHAPYYGQFPPPQLTSSNAFIPDITLKSSIPFPPISSYGGERYTGGTGFGWGWIYYYATISSPWINNDHAWHEEIRSSNGTEQWYPYSFTCRVTDLGYYSFTSDTGTTRAFSLMDSRTFFSSRLEPYSNNTSVSGTCTHYSHSNQLRFSVNPIVGHFFSLPHDYWDLEVYTDYSYGHLGPDASEAVTDDFKWYTRFAIREMLRTFNGYVASSAPYNATNMLPYVDRLNKYFEGWVTAEGGYQAQYGYLQTYGTKLSENYRDNSGNCWFLASKGGILARVVESRPYLSSIVDFSHWTTDEEATVRSAITFAVACGFNIPPTGNRAGDFINGAVVTLAKQAVEFVGGVVYNTQDVPAMVRDEDRAWAEAKTGLSYIDFHSMPGSLYCSPLFNIRVYAYPVKRTTILTTEA